MRRSGLFRRKCDVDILKLMSTGVSNECFWPSWHPFEGSDHLVSCCWRRMEKIIWTDRVKNEAVLHRVKEERNILHTIRQRKANWIGHILCRNCLLKHIIEGQISGTRRRGRRRKQMLDHLKEARTCLEVEGGSSGSHSLENSVWKKLWTCRKTDYSLILTCTSIFGDNMKIENIRSR
jgi:hypothetical protein